MDEIKHSKMFNSEWKCEGVDVNIVAGEFTHKNKNYKLRLTDPVSFSLKKDTSSSDADMEGADFVAKAASFDGKKLVWKTTTKNTGKDRDDKLEWEASANFVTPPPEINFPSHHPMMPNREMENCMNECLQLLSLRPKVSKLPPPPGLTFAAIQLLSRVCRSHKIATKALKKGGCELILNLPQSCTFAGRTVLVKSIFKHILEDPSTLQTAMEVEIRSAVGLLGKKLPRKRGEEKNADKTKTQPLVVNLKNLVNHCAPLICRDPTVFLKSCALTIEIDSESGFARLMSNEARAENAKILEKMFGHNHSHGEKEKEKEKKEEQQSQSQETQNTEEAARSPKRAYTPGMKRMRSKSSDNKTKKKINTNNDISSQPGTCGRGAKRRAVRIPAGATTRHIRSPRRGHHMMRSEV